MQGSGSGALSSFDDMLMDVADGAGTVSFRSLCVVLTDLFFLFFCENYVMQAEIQSSE